MAEAVFALKNIEVKKSFFSTKVIYVPTQSAVKAFTAEYSAENGALLKSILNATDQELKDKLAATGKIEVANVGNIRLEACQSMDKQFIALQMFRFSELMYVADTKMKVFEGKDAEAVAVLF